MRLDLKFDSLKETADIFKVPSRKLCAVHNMAKQLPDLYSQVKSGEVKALAAVKQQGKNVKKARVTAALATNVRPEDVTDGQMETRRDILATHPAPFPEALVERARTMLTYRRDLVVDPYNGGGITTAVAKR